ncbi:N-acetylglucosamine-specific PTS transporter subunit IIBC [Sphingomonas sp. 37zxx]|uniref:N-acetylglucosamine-specific PTS transporter subunit IIBC n=1 Tax=Sphingomonas sp. 37zxx TaxID=1550073 RepID=UPI000B288E9F|nr:N-acetylglucosamine-specific PTS transporter subunit IIBC [Sphingomonas sp. 37zxx]
MKGAMTFLQPLGRALMLPIAVLPVAGLLLRLGQPDLLDIAFLSAAGDAIFSNLGLLFAVGVATGFARDGNGAAALAGVVCFLVTTHGTGAFLIVPPALIAGLPEAAIGTVGTAWKEAQIARLDVPIGIASGLIGGLFYNRFATVKFHDSMAFFGGRRFVPIASGFAGLGLALLLGPGYGWVSAGVDAMSVSVVAAGGWGLFAFGVLNRLLLVTGLHHILNNVVYFVVGDYGGVTGDLRRFFAGDPTAGAFMSGFFPIMMFGLPAACLAMYHEAKPERRAATGGMLFSLALTSFLTGVTEPIEFSFMFLAPLLYGIHAVLTGSAEALMNALGVRLGYGFSAGLFDYVLNYGRATRPLMLLPVGAAYAVVYYAIFRFAIRRLDLPTPGREPGEAVPASPVALQATERGAAFVAALGGVANLREVGACTTRLRLAVGDSQAIDEPRLKALGARAVLRPSAHAVQVVIGPIADAVAMEMRQAMETGPAMDGAGAQSTPTAPMPETGGPLPDYIVQAVGGAGNIVESSCHQGRIRLQLRDAGLIDEKVSGVRGVARPQANVVHLLIGDDR